MNKIYTSGILLISFLWLASSCSKDFLKSYDRRIIGSWEITDVDRNGFGGSTADLPFKEGRFTFSSDGSLAYTDASGNNYFGTWNIQKKYWNDQTYQALEIQVLNFTTQQYFSEYYDDIDFMSTGHLRQG